MWYEVNDRLSIQALTYNFLPSWWHRNYGVSFGERIVFDPEYRVEAYRFMERTVHARFPALHIGSPDPPHRPSLPDFGNAITAAAAGCEVIYPTDNYPWNRHLAPECLPHLAVPADLSRVFPYCEIQAQAEHLRDRQGLDCPVVFNSRGVLNDAVLIGGPEFFTWLADEEPLARSLLAYSEGMLRATIEANYRSGRFREKTTLANCTIMLIHPGLYARRFLACDQGVERRLRQLGVPFGVHHCGSFGPYAPAYRQIPRLDWLEFGWGSDLRLALDLFPEATVQYILSAVFIANARPGEMGQKILEILDAVGRDRSRFRLTMPDVEYGTPDENLEEIYRALKEGESWTLW